MQDILETIAQWEQAGERIALATVIKVEGSAPRSEGAKMAISGDGKIAGSVSGGCVESAVAQEAMTVLATGTPTIVRYGINRNMMWDVGLSCGGAIEVFIEPLLLSGSKDPLLDWGFVVGPNHPLAVCTIVRGPKDVGQRIAVHADGSLTGSFRDPQVQTQACERAEELIAAGQSMTVSAGEFEIFVDVSLPEPQLIVVGAVHIAVSLCEMASLAGFSVTVIDPRSALCNRERFPGAKQLIVDWPEDALPKLTIDENTYVAVLTHDEKFDDPTLLRVLGSRARYVGAIGSKKTQALRRQRMLDAGVSSEAVERLRGPIGLDIGARLPQEIAVAILAEIIAAKYHPKNFIPEKRNTPLLRATNSLKLN
jgi:xanthine dehydrogenase accessory factor